jgi:ferric-dicitrate binding protein FerR (iron transport regulator)
MKDESKYINYQTLIVRFLSGDADDSEKSLLLDWLKENPDHVQEFNRIKEISDELKYQSEKVDFDAAKAFAAFKEKIHPQVDQPDSEPIVEIKKLNLKKRYIWYLSGAAAVITLLIAINFHISNSSSVYMIAKAEHQACSVVLKDGTKVSLAKNSSVFSSGKFDNGHRVVSLQGEATFEVKHDSNHPFTIKVNDISITDIGTVFRVNTDSVTKNTFIVVSEGIVRVNYFGNEVILYQGDYARTIAGSKKLLLGKKTVKSHSSESKLVFENTSLEDIVKSINNRYNTSFEIATPELKNYKLNLSFDSNTTVDEIKRILSLALNAKIEEQKGKLIIKKQPDGDEINP